MTCFQNQSDSDSDNKDSVIRRRQNKIVYPLSYYSETESYDDDNFKNFGGKGNIWVKTDKSPILGLFAGNPGIKQSPSDPTEVV